MNNEERSTLVAGIALLGLATFAALAGLPAPTLAQTSNDRRAESTRDADEQARTHFESGRIYFDEGSYERALAEFQAAYDLSHRSMLLLNMASANERLGRPEVAARILTQYLDEVPEATNRTSLERRIAQLEELATRQREQEEAERAEQARVAEAQRLEAENRAAEAERRAREAEEQARRASQVEPGRRDGPHRHLAGPLTAFGAGAAGFVVTLVAGPMALAKRNELADGCGADGSCTSAQVAPADRLALTADIGLGVGIAGAALGTVLLFVGPGRRQEDTRTGSRWRVMPVASGQGAAIVGMGEF